MNDVKYGDKKDFSVIEQEPLAFLCYSTYDDRHDNGYITKLRERLSGEVRMHTGKEFPIFQDRKNIAWGQNWEKRINGTLKSVTFLIPIVSPNFFASENCKSELRQFIEYEQKRRRNDLILPIYYVNCQELENEEISTNDVLAKAIKDHQYKDWRDLRNRDFTTEEVKKRLEKFAVEIQNAIDRVQETNLEESASDRIKIKDTSSQAQNIAESGDESSNTITKTIIVDKSQEEDYITINEAISTANPGDKILIRPGTYDEGLIISKPLEIKGENDKGPVIIQSKGQSVLRSITTKSHISSITMQQLGGGDWFCVDIAQGSIEIERCDITSQSSACIGIHDGADPILRHNRIHNSKQSGIFVFNRGKGTLEYNEIFENAYAGVEIRNLGDPTLRNNQIRNGNQSGVSVHDNGFGILEDNEIFGNASGVEIRKAGNPMLRQNRIYDNEQNGVTVHDNGHGILEGNDIFNNGYDGIAIRSKGNPKLRHNRIYDGKQGGIFVLDSGYGVLEENEIFGNSSDGVAIRAGGNPTLRNNRIFEGKSNGVYIFEKGLGLLENNEIFGNYHGVEIKSESNPTLRRNNISGCKQDGILVQENGLGHIEDNNIYANAYSGLEIRTGGNPIVRRNNIQDGKQGGILVQENGQGIIKDNHIFANAYSGVEIRTGENPTICGNNIHDGKQNGVFVHDNGQGVLESNEIINNALSGVEIFNDGNPIMKNNKIKKNRQYAIYVHDRSSGTIENNDLRNNDKGAWKVVNDCESRLMSKGNLE